MNKKEQIIKTDCLTNNPVKYILSIYFTGEDINMVSKIQDWGNSQGIRIPKSILDELNWSKNESIIIKIIDNKLVIEKEKKRKNIKELFKDYDKNYNPVEIDWGNKVGDEIW